MQAKLQALRNIANRAALPGALMLTTALPASAAVDVSDVTAAITDAATAIGTVGLAVLVMFVGAKVFKWVRKAL
jgi:hypothetical protein